MNRREALIAAVLVGVGIAGAWLAHLHVISQTYHPVVRLSSPDGLTYIAVQDAREERQACGRANDRFLRPVKSACKECAVVMARCERVLEGVEHDLSEGRQIPHHMVKGPGMRMAIQGPEKVAKASCEHIARQMVQSGLRVAACLYPARS